MKSRIILFFLSTIVILLLVVSCSMAPALRGNTPGNLVNGGRIAQSDDWIYYSNTIDGYKLYKIRTDGTGKEKLNDDDSRFINVVGDWIYYNKTNPVGDYELYKIRTDGTDRQAIDAGVDYFGIQVVDDWIYYYHPYDDSFGVYKVRTDGTDKTKLTSSGSGISVVDGWIYYSYREDKNLYKIRTDGTELIKLSDDYMVSNIIVVDDLIYYIGHYDYHSGHPDDHGIYRIRADGTDRKKLSSGDSIGDFNISGDWIYFCKLNDHRYYDGNLYRMRTDGTDREKMNNMGSALINIIGDWIYYENRKWTSTAYGTSYHLYKIRTDGTENQRVENQILAIGSNITLSWKGEHFWNDICLFNLWINVNGEDYHAGEFRGYELWQREESGAPDEFLTFFRGTYSGAGSDFYIKRKNDYEIAIMHHTIDFDSNPDEFEWDDYTEILIISIGKDSVIHIGEPIIPMIGEI